MDLLRKKFMRSFSMSIRNYSIDAKQEIKINTVRLNNMDFKYPSFGNGPEKVLCLPGAYGHVKNQLGPIFVGLDPNKYTAIGFDPIGFGYNTFQKRVYVDDFHYYDGMLAAQLMEKLNIHKYNMLGFCDGGGSATIIAAKYPDKVNKLVMWSSRCHLRPDEFEFVKDIATTKASAEFQIRIRNPSALEYGQEYYEQITRDLIESYAGILKKDGDICYNYLKDVKCPVLIVFGGCDELVNRKQAYNMGSKLSNVRIVEYEDATHMLHFKYTDDFLKRIHHFFDHNNYGEINVMNFKNIII